MDDSNDKLIAAIGYPIWFVALVPLLTEAKDRPFAKFHAVQALILNLALAVVSILVVCVLFVVFTVLTAVTGICGICFPVVVVLPFILWLPTLYYAYLTYQDRSFDIPVITDMIVNQGWVQRP